MYDLARDTLTRLTFDGNNRAPLWTPDGQKITYAHFAKAGSVGAADIYWTHADGTGSPLRLTDGSSGKFPSSDCRPSGHNRTLRCNALPWEYNGAHGWL